MDQAREQAMRSAFTQLHALRSEMRMAESDVERHQLQERAAAVSEPWATGPDATEWEWLNNIADVWRITPESMRALTDNARHDRYVGQSPYTEVQYRSLHQVGDLVDELYRDQTQWRAEHLELAAAQGRLDARLHTIPMTPDVADELRQAKTAVWEAVWGNHSDRWSPERRQWEMTYAMDAVNRDAEREAYLSAYAAQSHRPTGSPATDAAGATTDFERDGTRIGRLLTAATSGIDPASTPPAELDQNPSPSTTLDAHPIQRGAGHELG